MKCLVSLANQGAENNNRKNNFTPRSKTEGEVKFKGKDVHSLSKDELRKHRPNMRLVFQDPFSSLNPRMRIGEALGEPMLAHGLATKENVREKVIEVLELCGLAPYHIDRYPHEFSVDNVSVS